MSTSGDHKPPHVALLPSAGMGHLTPFTRLAVALSNRGCDVSLIAALPMVSSAESLHISALLSSHPRIRPLDLHIPLSSTPTAADPFFLRFESIRQSTHLLPPLLATADPPISALVIDISLASAFVPATAAVSLPCYVLFTSSADMLSLCAFFPTYISGAAGAAAASGVEIPGLRTVPLSSIPPALHDPSHLFTKQFVTNGRALLDADGILVNTWQALEPEALAALNGGHVAAGLPKVIPVGPLLPVSDRNVSDTDTETEAFRWLNGQPARSVVYVSFGSRTAISREQIKELGAGLEVSGWRFLWCVKSKIVDREDAEELEEVLGEGFLERVEGRGLVVKGWVEQEEVLSHAAVGGFVSHCGWNSVTEAAVNGVRVLGWPRGGDQRVTAATVRKSGLGIWVEEWSWEAEGRVVGGEEIGRRVRELMEDKRMEESAARVEEAAARAVADGGSSDRELAEFIGKLMM